MKKVIYLCLILGYITLVVKFQLYFIIWLAMSIGVMMVMGFNGDKFSFGGIIQEDSNIFKKTIALLAVAPLIPLFLYENYSKNG